MTSYLAVHKVHKISINEFVLKKIYVCLSRKRMSLCNIHCPCSIRGFYIQRKKEEIWLSPMTKAPTQTKMSKGQSDNTNNAIKTFDYTAVADRLRTVNWSNYSHPTGVVNLVYGPNLLTPHNSRVIKRKQVICANYIRLALDQHYLKKPSTAKVYLSDHREEIRLVLGPSSAL